MRTALVLIGFIITAGHAIAQTEPTSRIASVRIVGNRKVPTDKVLECIHSKPGEAFTRRPCKRMSHVWRLRACLQKDLKCAV